MYGGYSQDSVMKLLLAFVFSFVKIEKWANSIDVVTGLRLWSCDLNWRERSKISIPGRFDYVTLYR